jgi:hypothetical protein
VIAAIAGRGWVGQAVAADSLTIGSWLKGHVGENVGSGLVHQGVKLWNLGPQLVGDLAPLGFGGLGVVPRERRRSCFRATSAKDMGAWARMIVDSPTHPI